MKSINAIVTILMVTILGTGCAPTVKEVGTETAVLPEIDVVQVKEHANEALRLAQEAKLDVQVMNTKFAEIDNRLILLSEDIAAVSAARLEEIENRLSLLVEAFRDLKVQVDAIDVYYIHGWDKDTDVAETLATLGDLRAAGKIHNVAWSNVCGYQLQKIVSTAQAHGYPVPVAMQPHYNMLERGAELEIIPVCLENGIALAPWSPLGGGWLTGKYDSDNFPSGATRLGEDPKRGVEAYELRNVPRTYQVLDKVRSIAERHGRPMSHVALAWLLSRPGMATILLGARTTTQLKENLDAVDLVLEPSEIAALTEVSATGIPAYPYQFLSDWAKVDHWSRLGT